MKILLRNKWTNVGISEEGDTLPDDLPAGTIILASRGMRDGFISAEDFRDVAESLPGGDQLRRIRGVLEDYHVALDTHARGGAVAHLVTALETILEQPWVSGAATQRRDILADIALAVGDSMPVLKNGLADRAARDELASLFCGVIKKYLPAFPGDAIEVRADPDQPHSAEIHVDPEAAKFMKEQAPNLFGVFMHACQNLKA